MRSRLSAFLARVDSGHSPSSWSRLESLGDLGIANNTIVVYTSDNGAEMMTWPDGGSTPYRGEKATNWEGAYRVPTLIRWPGVVKAGTIYNDFFAHEDLLPTLAAAAGNPDIVGQCMKTCTLNGKPFHVHLDGYNLVPYFKGEVKESPRKVFFIGVTTVICLRSA